MNEIKLFKFLHDFFQTVKREEMKDFEKNVAFKR